MYIPIVFLFDIKKIEERKITFFFPCKKFSKKINYSFLSMFTFATNHLCEPMLPLLLMAGKMSFQWHYLRWIENLKSLPDIITFDLRQWSGKHRKNKFPYLFVILRRKRETMLVLVKKMGNTYEVLVRFGTRIWVRV